MTKKENTDNVIDLSDAFSVGLEVEGGRNYIEPLKINLGKDLVITFPNPTQDVFRYGSILGFVQDTALMIGAVENLEKRRKALRGADEQARIQDQITDAYLEYGMKYNIHTQIQLVEAWIGPEESQKLSQVSVSQQGLMTLIKTAAEHFMPDLMAVGDAKN